MSAFYDIWIGDNSSPEPKEYRSVNNSWHKYGKLGQNSWCSFPKDKYECFQTFSNEIADIIILGQFYEKINIEELLNNCLRYIDNVSQSFSDPAGHFIIFVYCKEKKEHHVFTNRLGTYHVYYSSIGSNNILSTYYLGLAKEAANKVLDWAGITGFLATGFFPDNTTYLEGISILEPASHYAFDSDIKLLYNRRYWNWTYTPVETTNENLFEELDSILVDSLQYATEKKRVALPISGGLDSRMISGIITQNKMSYESLWSYSYGYSEKSVETKIALEIARTRNISFDSYVVPNYLFDNTNLISDSVELFQYVDGTRQAFMKDTLETNSDCVIGGHWGDVWMDETGVEGMSETQFFNRKIIKKGSKWLLEEICKQHYPNYITFLDNYINNWSNKYKHIDNIDFRMKIFKTDQWSFRWTVPSLRMYQAAVMPILPFYDKRVVDFFTKIDTSVFKARNFQIEYLKEYHKDLAKITWQEYDSNLFNYKKYNNRNLAYRAMKKAGKILSGKKHISRNWEIFYLNGVGKTKLENMLLVNAPFNEIVPIETAKQALNNFYDSPSAENGYKISMLHTLALFMKKVF